MHLWMRGWTREETPVLQKMRKKCYENVNNQSHDIDKQKMIENRKMLADKNYEICK